MTNNFEEIINENPDILKSLDFLLQKDFPFSEFQKKYDKIIDAIIKLENPSLKENEDSVKKIREELYNLVDEYGITPFIIDNSIRFKNINIGELIDLQTQDGNKIEFSEEYLPYIKEGLLNSHKEKTSEFLNLYTNQQLYEDGISVKDVTFKDWISEQEIILPKFKEKFTTDQQKVLFANYLYSTFITSEAHASYIEMLTERKGDCSSISYLTYDNLSNLKDKSGNFIFTDIKIISYINDEHARLSINGILYESTIGGFPPKTDKFANKHNVELDKLGLIGLQLIEYENHTNQGGPLETLTKYKMAYIFDPKNGQKDLIQSYGATVVELVENGKEYEAYKIMKESKTENMPFSLYDSLWKSLYKNAIEELKLKDENKGVEDYKLSSKASENCRIKLKDFQKDYEQEVISSSKSAPQHGKQR